MNYCRFTLFPQEINILQWEIEFDQDRFKNMEDTWTEKYDRYLTCTVYNFALNAVCHLSCVPSLLHQVLWVFSVLLVPFQIWEDLFNFHASHICIFQLKLLKLLSRNSLLCI